MLSGYYKMEDLHQCRQWGSITPGHPEADVMHGVENTSGPLGQGHAMALGAAIAERFMVARFGEWMAHKTYAFISDGAVQEEISQGVGRIAGHLGLANLIMYYDANNVQLSTKVDEIDTEDVAAKYLAVARDLAAQWKEMSADGDHYKLTFDRPGTWSQKYNLVWDELLDLGVFDDDIMDAEIPYYLTKQNVYGLPLDNRSTYSKSDWIIWTATMADSDEQFEAFIEPLWKFYNETVDRVPMSDWFYTDKPEYCMFIARSVVGGYFIKMLPEIEVND
jgi:hypothetical protein